MLAKTRAQNKPRKNTRESLQRRLGNPFGKGKRPSLSTNKNNYKKIHTMKLIHKLALAICLAAVGLSGATASPQGSPVVMKITGGSTGKFLNTPHSINTSGFTDFALNITVRADGSATGEFACAVPNAIVIAGQAVAATTNTDGSVTVTGVGYGYIVGVGGFENDSFFVTVRPGGPRVGGFDFADANFPEGFYDTESLLVGSINIAR